MPITVTETPPQCAEDLRQYLYHVLKKQSSLPEDALYMIRYHSFYPYVITRRARSTSPDTSGAVGTERARTHT